MRDIYMKATRTIVFLGDDSLGTHWILPILKEITWSQTWKTDEERQVRIETKTKFQQQLSTTRGVKGMLSEGFYGDIATRPFWTRMWIVQEVVLSRNPIIMFGDHEVLGIALRIAVGYWIKLCEIFFQKSALNLTALQT
jgi:hypothetical protein